MSELGWFSKPRPNFLGQHRASRTVLLTWRLRGGEVVASESFVCGAPGAAGEWSRNKTGEFKTIRKAKCYFRVLSAGETPPGGVVLTELKGAVSGRGQREGR